MRLLLPAPGGDLDRDGLERLYAYPTEADRWVRATFVSGVDGAVQGPDGRSGSLSGPADRQVFALLRALADVIVVGAGTARVEGYLPVEPEPWQLQLRARLGLAPAPVIAVVTRSLDLPPRLLAGGLARTVVLTGSDHAAADLAAARRLADVVALPTPDVDLADGVSALCRRGLTRVHCEGGPTLLAAAVTAGVLDELCLTFAPTMTGGSAARLLAGPRLDPPVGLRLAHLLAEGGTLFTRYLVVR